jgi:hypothetical protein
MKLVELAILSTKSEVASGGPKSRLAPSQRIDELNQHSPMRDIQSHAPRIYYSDQIDATSAGPRCRLEN